MASTTAEPKMAAQIDAAILMSNIDQLSTTMSSTVREVQPQNALSAAVVPPTPPTTMSSTTNEVVQTPHVSVVSVDAIPKELYHHQEKEEEDEEDATLIEEQFMYDADNKQLVKARRAVKGFPADVLPGVMRDCSQGMIDVIAIHEASRQKEAAKEEAAKPKPKSKKSTPSAKEIIAQQAIAKQKRHCCATITLMKANASAILNEAIPTADTLAGILESYDTEFTNTVMKIIILRSITQRFIVSNDESLVPLIFEFLMLMYEMRDIWNSSMPEELTTTSAAATAKPTGKRSHREKRREVNATMVTSDFDYPTADEILTEEFNDRIKMAIVSYVLTAERIIRDKQIDPINYQMTQIYHRLKPLSPWDKKLMRLEPWQIETINLIDAHKSVVITAPTSSGKTVVAQYCAAKNKTLFIVPNPELVMQVCGSFRTHKINAAYVTEDESYYMDSNPQVVVATPRAAETQLHLRQLEFEYAVFDEIQQINSTDGECIERLIKIIGLFKCPFLILSATIQNPELFCEYLEGNVPNKKVHLKKYNKRFIVLQKHLFDGLELKPLNPLACVDVEYITKDRFSTGDLAMTARDAYDVGIALTAEYPEYARINKLHPHEHFEPTVSITIDMVTDYERKLKTALVELTAVDSTKMANFLEQYQVKDCDIWKAGEDNVITCLIDLFKIIKNKNKAPALVYMSDDINVFDTFTAVVKQLEYLEGKYFPWYQDFMTGLYQKTNEMRSKENMRRETVASSLMNVRGNKKKAIDDAINQQNRTYVRSFMDAIQVKYIVEKERCAINDDLSEAERQMIIRFLDVDYEYKEEIYWKNQISNTDIKLPEFNPYCPTSIFSFHKTPISAGDMRLIVREMQSLFRQTVEGVSASDMFYDNIIVRGLERGIVVYSDQLPTPFLRIIYNLIQRKMVPICMCSKSLTFGINLAIRTVVILGVPTPEIVEQAKMITSAADDDDMIKQTTMKMEEIDTLIAQQVQGRAGRRGLDTQGNVIYVRVNFKTIMRGTYAPLIGKDIFTPYSLLPAKALDGYGKEYIQCLTTKPLRCMTQKEHYDQLELLESYKEQYAECDLFTQGNIMLLLLWLYRDDDAIAQNILILVNQLVIEFGDKFSVKTIKHASAKDFERAHIPNHLAFPEELREVKYTMDERYTWQIIDLLFRIFDQKDNDDTEYPEDESADVGFEPVVKNPIHAKVNGIIGSRIWAVKPNFKNNATVRAILLNEYDRADIKAISKISCSTTTVIRHILTLYNLFVELKNSKIVGILEVALTKIIHFNNQIKSFNN